MEVLDNKCPACGAKIEFNPKNQKWDCSYCGSKFSIEEMQKYDNASSKENNKIEVKLNSEKKLEEMDVYHCKNCGAEVMADETTTATFCLYCGSTTILKDRIIDGIAPSKIIPFKNVKDDVVKEFKNLYKGRPLMPKLFNDAKNIEKLVGVYIPFWSYDLNVFGDINFKTSDTKTWSDYDYSYTKTDEYLTKKDARMNYNGVLVDASSRFDDDLMDSLEPFNFNELQEYNHAYLSGFLSEKYDVDQNKAIERASTRAMNTSIEQIKNTITKNVDCVESNNLNIKNINTDYILLPVWMMNIDYNGKKYMFAMNGQTRKIVGNIPIDKKKAVIIFLFIFVIVFIIGLIISILMGAQI
ncbi:MAG: hypothetical protein Q4E39_05460 [bacterium]|nr:hypothetical protein [bacterium]